MGRAGEAEKWQDVEKAEEEREKEAGRECARLMVCGSIENVTKNSNLISFFYWALLFSVPSLVT